MHFPSVDCLLGWVLGIQSEQSHLSFETQLLVSVSRLASDSSSKGNHLVLSWSSCDTFMLAWCLQGLSFPFQGE